MLINICLVYIIVKKKPYKEKIYGFRDFFTELNFFLIHLVSMPLLNNDNLEADAKNNIGLAIIAFIIIILVV